MSFACPVASLLNAQSCVRSFACPVACQVPAQSCATTFTFAVSTSFPAIAKARRSASLSSEPLSASNSVDLVLPSWHISRPGRLPLSMKRMKTSDTTCGIWHQGGGIHQTVRRLQENKQTSILTRQDRYSTQALRMLDQGKTYVDVRNKVTMWMSVIKYGRKGKQEKESKKRKTRKGN